MSVGETIEVKRVDDPSLDSYAEYEAAHRGGIIFIS